ncbi:hypothetical protein HOO65_060479 [Ceratocystis lukuohia]|uniref:WHIM1 domain-containing protein n=1 Tax=Ceratocystis lukuohia TaxID=2019550 RepID=A0ABR4MEF8_9PEZI
MSDDSSDLSSISSLSPAPSDSEPETIDQNKKGILKFFKTTPKAKSKPKAKARSKTLSKAQAKPKSQSQPQSQVKPKQKKIIVASKEPSPPLRKREPSPPHEYVFADNPDIADAVDSGCFAHFIVMFRARFNDIFSAHLATFGPQEFENDITDFFPGNRVEGFLCALLMLILNRKQDVKPGHYNRALEEAISTHKNQWPKSWEGKSPVSGSNTFQTLAPSDKLILLRTLIHWALASSESIRTLVAKSYKNRHDEDRAIPLSVQAWGSDSDKRRYFLIEGRDGTSFRIYRESNFQGLNRTWWSVADSIDSLKALATSLEEKDGGPKAKSLAHSMRMAIPRLEESEEKRRRREYRLKTKERFLRPDPAHSLYEGRTRGKRVKYTFSDEEDVFTDYSARRSTRNTRNHTPEDAQIPVQHSRSTRSTRLNPDAQLSGTESAPNDSREPSVGANGRPRRQAAQNQGSKRKSLHAAELNVSDDDDQNIPEADDGGEHIPDESNSEDEEEFAGDDEMGDDDEEVVRESKNKTTKAKAAAERPDDTNNPDGLLSPSADSNGKDHGPTRSDCQEVSVTNSLETPDESPLGNRQTPEPEVEGNKIKITLKSSASASKRGTSLAFRGSPDKPHASMVTSPGVDA